MELTAERIVELLGLEPLPVEGGLFRQTWHSAEMLPKSALPARYGSERPAGTAIYYLLTDAPDSFSALHRLATDEVYHFYLGDPVQLLMLHPDESSEKVVLGTDLAAGQRVQHVVPHGVWQGSRLRAGGRFALLGATMAPGYKLEDYEAGDRGLLTALYPDVAPEIVALTHPSG